MKNWHKNLKKEIKKIDLNKNKDKNNHLKDFIKYIQEHNLTNDSAEEGNAKTCQESIKNIYNSIWIKRFINNNNKDNKINIGKESTINNKNILNLIKTNYYIREGYYSHLNLNKCIIKNIEYNDNFKNNNNLHSYSLLDDINTLNNNEINNVSDNNKTDNQTKNKSNIVHKNNSNNDIIKNEKKQIKKIDLNKNKIKSIKNSLSDIIKKAGSSHPKENNKNKRNKNKNNNNDNKESKKKNKFCSTDNCNNQIISQTLNKKKEEIMKIESNSVLTQKRKEIINFEKKESKKQKDKDKDKDKDKNKDKDKETEEDNNNKENKKKKK